MKNKPPFDGEIHAVSAKTMPDLNSPKREPGWFLGEPTPQTTPTRDEAVPAGWKLVPVEPTDAMTQAAMSALDTPFYADLETAYRAMLASAPAPASGRVDAVAVTDWLAVARAAGQHGIRYRTNRSLEAFLSGIRSALSPAATPASEAGPVAWMDDGSTRAGSHDTEFRVVTAKTKADMPKSMAEAYTTPLYALAKPASSPAGVREALQKLYDGGVACHDLWFFKELKQIIAALSQSTSAGRVGE